MMDFIRKVTKILLWIAGLTVALYALVLIAIPILVKPDPIEPRALPERTLELLTEAVGWYEVEPGVCALLTYAANGGLAFVSAEGDPFLQRFELVEPSRFVWSPGPEERGRDVGLARGDEGEVIAIEWTDEDNEHKQAPRCVGPYEPRDASFANGDVELSGTLFVPTTPGPHPAAVIIHGSGTSHRDNLWYLQIAHHLLSHEIAVLLPDKRGSGLSSGEWRLAGFEDFVADTNAGVEWARQQPEIDPSRVGFVGVSQGGSWIAPMAAANRSDLPFVVSLSGATVTPNQQLAHESVQTLVQQGFPRLVAIALQPIASAVPKARRPIWWEKNGDVDPIPYWERVEAPVLVLYGREDERDNVPVQTSVDRLTTMKARSDPDITVQVFDGVGHGFREPGSKQIRPDVLELLGNWIALHVQPR
ncbi:MAG: alpha/beta fold hydrolase [Thermoanaerobaculia bacterium]|jgi:dienelactone hydrolase